MEYGSKKCHKIYYWNEHGWLASRVKRNRHAVGLQFHGVISTKHNACFPYCTISKKYYKNEPWLSAALKESTKIKNKIIYKVENSGDSEKVSIYKKYSNKLNQLIRSAERKHFHDILLEHKSNLKKSWQVIKEIYSC